MLNLTNNIQDLLVIILNWSILAYMTMKESIVPCMKTVLVVEEGRPIILPVPSIMYSTAPPTNHGTWERSSVELEGESS